MGILPGRGHLPHLTAQHVPLFEPWAGGVANYRSSEGKTVEVEYVTACSAPGVASTVGAVGLTCVWVMRHAPWRNTGIAVRCALRCLTYSEACVQPARTFVHGRYVRIRLTSSLGRVRTQFAATLERASSRS